MLPFFRYSLIKILRSKSTWIVVALSFAGTMILAGFLPFSLANSDRLLTRLRAVLPDENNIAAASQSFAQMMAYYVVISIFLIFISVFAGFKGAYMFRDEVEDGSLLIMLSKPIARSKLMLSKWLAFLLAIFAFVVLLSLAHAFGILAGSRGNNLSARTIFAGIGMEILLGSVIALIFSAIALLASTVLSSALTIGVTVAFGLVAPLTSIIQTATYTQRMTTSPALTVRQFFKFKPEEVEELVSTGSGMEKLMIRNPQLNMFLLNSLDGITDKVSAIIAAPTDQPTKEDAIKELLTPPETLPFRDHFNWIELEEAVFLPTPELRAKKIDELTARALYIDSGTVSTYRTASIFDFNYQASLLSSIIVDQTGVRNNFAYSEVLSSLRMPFGAFNDSPVPQSAVFLGPRDDNFTLGQLMHTRANELIKAREEYKALGDRNNPLYAFAQPFCQAIQADLDSGKSGGISEFLKVPVNLFQSFPENEKNLYTRQNSTDFLNKYVVLAIYISFALIITPLSFFMIRRLNFR